MARQRDEENVIENVHDSESDTVFYPYYLFKHRTNTRRRKSSLQSWQQRHKVKIIRRLVRKSGKSSIHTKTTTERSYKFILDLFNTLIEGSWFTILLIVSLIFVISWFTFAGFWAVISVENVDNWNGTSDTCLEGINSFAGYLLFSVETQTTIGYGSRYIKEYCVEAIVGLCIQLLFGVGVCGSLICIVFVKMGGPLHSRNTITCFSRKAVICQRDGCLCLIFRVRDCDRRYECHTKIAAFVAVRGPTAPKLQELKLEPPGILLWPLDVRHKIDSKSPFWDLSAKDLIFKRFEIIVMLEGESLATSFVSRTVTSYLSREIKWGYKFNQCTSWDKVARKYVVNHRLFNKTEEVQMPLCSAQRLSEVYEDLLSSISPYNGSFSGGSKLSTPSIRSPLITSFKSFTHDRVKQVKDDEDSSVSDEDEVQCIAQVHREKSESESRESSDNEDYTTFMDLSLNDVRTEEKEMKKLARLEVELRKKDTDERPRTLSGTAKEFFVNLQKYVTEAGRSKNRTSRKYEETDF
ncbi:G protein-activated inward rectifier potassium channel 3-like [Sitophilus oryzae]|uniref:G protein-activated inward rectifier potassium channel 3-like n=1 Tax=Sitophilus oryzae TaxID=7048 RepID=A0A6J2YH94_SITOR|nr:G protein-activated inward rectifier potassium channel 3-like [Sitophilus oryzae]